MRSFYHRKKVLITGGLGFLGSNLARRLFQLGAKVTLIDNLLEGHGANFFNLDGIKVKLRSLDSGWSLSALAGRNDGQVQLVKGDIRERPLMEKLLKGQEYLFNIAAQTSHTDSMDHPLLDADINCKGQITLLEACRKVCPGIRIVYSSTRAIYGSALAQRKGSSKTTVDEACLPRPMDIYSSDKLAGENYHRVYSAVHGLNCSILRIANSYGPRAQMRGPSFGILNWFIRLAIDGGEIKVFGDGKQVRDYVYIDDIVDAFLKAGVEADRKAEIFNVGSGRGVPLIAIVKKIVEISGSGRIVHVPWPEKNKKIDVGDFIADVRKFRKATGWRSQVSLDEGLSKTIVFYKKNKRLYW